MLWLRNILNVHQIQSPEFINSVQPALELLTVLAKWQLLETEEVPEDYYEMEHEGSSDSTLQSCSSQLVHSKSLYAMGTWEKISPMCLHHTCPAAQALFR
jgi:hypothetical protein